jgi:hypothetical protein
VSEKTGWLMTVEFVTASTNTLLKKEKFLIYPKKSTAVDALPMIVGSAVLEVIAINNEASCPITLRQTDRLIEVAMTKELLDEPVCYETDDWRCVISSVDVSPHLATLALAAGSNNE